MHCQKKPSSVQYNPIQLLKALQRRLSHMSITKHQLGSVQAAVMEMLGLPEDAENRDATMLCQSLVHAFSAFAKQRRMQQQPPAPLHVPQLYLRVWTYMQAPPMLGHNDLAGNLAAYAGPLADARHPGLVTDVPRKRRSGATGIDVRAHDSHENFTATECGRTHATASV